MRVLIVDDSTLVRKVTCRALKLSGLPVEQVSEAGDGVQALEQIRQGIASPPGFDLVLSDVHMPQMDGLALAEELGRMPMRPLLVIVSSETAEPQVLRARDAGADGYLTKPFTPEELRARLLPLLERAAAAQRQPAEA